MPALSGFTLGSLWHLFLAAAIWSVQQIVDLAKRLGKLDDPSIRAQLRRIVVWSDQSLAESLLRRLTIEAGDEAFDPPPFKPFSQSATAPPDEGLPRVALGGALKGNDPDDAGQQFAYPLEAGHLIFLGRTRMGKSMAVRKFLSCLPDSTHWIIVDSENDLAYIDLALSQPADRCRVIDWQDLRVSLPVPPRRVARPVWWAQFKRNCGEGLFIRDGGKAMLSAVMEHCAKQNEIVALRDIHKALIELRYRLIQGGREYSFYESLKNRLDSLLTIPVFDCAVGFDIDDLISKNTLLRCRGMGIDEFALVLNDLLLRLACTLEPTSDRVPRFVVVIEELHRMTNPQRLRRADIAEAIVLDAVRTLAKCGACLVFVDQVVSELPPQILANCGFRAIFNTIEGRDLDVIQRSLSLNWEQRTALSRLPRQVCLVQCPGSDESFLMKVADCDVSPRSPEEIQARTKQSVAELPFIASAPRAIEAAKPASCRTPLLSKPAIDYFLEIHRDQFVAASKRDERLTIPISQGNALRKELVAAGVIALETVNTCGRARRITNTRVTDAGYELLKSLKVDHERVHGRGGWEHLFHQRSIADWAKRNSYAASIEKNVDGKSVDVLLEKDGHRIGVEILCHGVEKELNNLRDLHGICQTIWFCVADARQAARLKDTIRARFAEEASVILSRTEFKLLGGFQNPGEEAQQ